MKEEESEKISKKKALAGMIRAQDMKQRFFMGKIYPATDQGQDRDFRREPFSGRQVVD